MFSAAIAVVLAASAMEVAPRRFEAVLYPATAQVNGKWSQHYGSALTLLWHPHHLFALQVTGHYHWLSQRSGFSDELTWRARTSPEFSTALLSTWGVLAGFEMEPLEGEALVGERGRISLSLFLNGGIGVGGSRVQLLGPTTGRPAQYGDAGARWLGQIGGGVKVELGRWFALRLELRDLFFNGRVERINGCTADELFHMIAVSSLPSDRMSSRSCDGSAFGDEAVWTRNVSLAWQGMLQPQSDTVHVVSVFLGLSLTVN